MRNTLYRALSVGEVIRPTDEVLTAAGTWDRVRFCAGQKLEPGLSIRRHYYDTTKVRFSRADKDSVHFLLPGGRTWHVLYRNNGEIHAGALLHAVKVINPIQACEVWPMLSCGQEFLGVNTASVRPANRDAVRLLVATLQDL